MITTINLKVGTILLIYFTLLIVSQLTSSVAYADNCGSLSDCFNGLLIPAILVVLGLVIVIGVAMYWPVILGYARVLVFSAWLSTATMQPYARRFVEKVSEVGRSPTVQNLITKSMDHLNKPAQFNHVFGKVKHGLDQVVARCGGYRGFMDKFLEQVYKSGRMPPPGTYAPKPGIEITVEGIKMIVRGYNDGGIFKPSTVFIPP